MFAGQGVLPFAIAEVLIIILLRIGILVGLVYLCYKLVQKWKKNDSEKENKKK